MQPIPKQLIASGSYKNSRCHVVCQNEEKSFYVGLCGRHLSGSDLQRHDWPAGPDGIYNFVICDKCWVELSPEQWKLLRLVGCLPAFEWAERTLKYKADELAKKTGTQN